MKQLSCIVLLFACAASAAGQTVKSVAFNTTNNNVVSTNRIIFPLLGASSGTASTPSLAFSVSTNVIGFFATTQIGIGPYMGFSVDGTRRFYIATNTLRADVPISFSSASNATTTARNLANSTNTNEPFSGVFKFNNPEDNQNYEATVSNGLILQIIQY